jgi:hypothetical protein
MKRITFVAAVLAIAACSGGEKAPEATPEAQAPAAAPAPADTGMKMDSTAKMADTAATKKAP